MLACTQVRAPYGDEYQATLGEAIQVERILLVACMALIGCSSSYRASDGGDIGMEPDAGSLRAQLLATLNDIGEFCDKEILCDVRPMLACAGPHYDDELFVDALRQLTDDEVKRCLDALPADRVCGLALDCDAYKETLTYSFCSNVDAPSGTLPERCCFDAARNWEECPDKPFPCEDERKRAAVSCEAFSRKLLELAPPTE